MKVRNQIPYFVGALFAIVLSACAAPTAAPSAGLPPAPTPVTEAAPADVTEAPTANGNPYSPVTAEVCQIIKESAEGATGLTFTMEPKSGFMDYITGETGDGCLLTAEGTGAQLAEPSTVLDNLVAAMVGWEEQPEYRADSPMGAAAALKRDMGLMLVSASWSPAPEVQCPADQPISACDVKPEQQLYAIQIQAAMK